MPLIDAGTPWVSDQELESLWPDAPESPARELWLAAAQSQCEEYAPALTTIEGESGDPDQIDIPERYQIAVVMQMRALWQSIESTPQAQLGVEDIAVPVYPMDWTVKNLLRPRRRVPKVR